MFTAAMRPNPIHAQLHQTLRISVIASASANRLTTTRAPQFKILRATMPVVAPADSGFAAHSPPTPAR